MTVRRVILGAVSPQVYDTLHRVFCPHSHAASAATPTDAAGSARHVHHLFSGNIDDSLKTVAPQIADFRSRAYGSINSARRRSLAIANTIASRIGGGPNRTKEQ